jgi:hypothetical protein
LNKWELTQPLPGKRTSEVEAEAVVGGFDAIPLSTFCTEVCCWSPMFNPPMFCVIDAILPLFPNGDVSELLKSLELSVNTGRPRPRPRPTPRARTSAGSFIDPSEDDIFVTSFLLFILEKFALNRTNGRQKRTMSFDFQLGCLTSNWPIDQSQIFVLNSTNENNLQFVLNRLNIIKRNCNKNFWF